MHLLINGLSARLGGGQTYLYQLLRNAPRGCQITLLSCGTLQLDSLAPNIEHVSMPQLRNPFRRAWWERTALEALAIKRGCDAILNPACLLPPMRTALKTAVTFQNMLPFDAVQRKRYPFFSYRRLRDWLLERAMTDTMRRADLVIFISQYARDSMHQRGIHPKREALIPHALDASFLATRDTAAPLLPDDFTLRGESYFLYVSFIDHYKCQREMLQAYAALRAQHGITTKLVLAGSGYAPYVAAIRQDIVRLGLSDAVVLLGNLPHEALSSLYQNASLNLFASLCENCPNILLEMMAANRPALISKYGPMPEIAGDTVTYFDPMDHENFIAAWLYVLQNPEASALKASQALVRAATHRWEERIQSTYRAITEMVSV